MTDRTQIPEHLNAAILAWTHELAPHGIFTTDTELRITSWNHWLESHSGLRLEQVLGRHLVNIFPSVTDRRIDDYFSDALRGEIRVLSRALHGYLLPFPPSIPDTKFEHMQQSARIAPLLLDGKVYGTITIIEDVTEREWHADTLRASEERFRVMADTVPDIIYTADAEGRHDFVNRRFYESTGLPADSGLDFIWLQAVHPEDVGRVKAEWQRSLQTGNPFQTEFRMRDQGNNFRWFISRAWPVCDEAQRVVRWFGASTDIHEMKQAEEALAEAQEQLKQYASNLEQKVNDRTAELRETISHLESFSYTVAHDLRAPIRAMESYANMLLLDLGPSLNEEPKTMLSNMARAARHLDSLTRDVLNYTKVSTQDIQLQPVQIDDVLHDVTAMNRALQAPQSIIAVVRPLHCVMAHPTLLGQCLSNLLDNAVKFVAPTIVPRIVIRSQLCGDSVRVWIEDNGIGMDAATQQKIFGIFERGRAATNYPGTGIGLAIVGRAVERMRGAYGVESEPGKGSRFWIELPVARP